MSNARHPENAVPNETPEETPDPIVEPPRASITITEPKFVNKTRNFVKRHASKAGMLLIGAAAGAAAVLLPDKDDSDEHVLLTDEDGNVIMLEATDPGLYASPSDNSSTEN